MKFRKLFFSTFIILLTFTVGTSYGSRVSTLPQPGVKTLASHLTDIDNNFKELYRLIFAAESGYTGLGAGIITSGVLSDARIPDGITRDTELTSGLATKQNASANLTTFAGIAPAANIISILTAADYPAIKALLDLETGVDFYSISSVDSLLANKQTLNTHLTDLADGSLTGSKIGTGIIGDYITSGTIPDAVIPSAITRDSELTAGLATKQDINTHLTDLTDGSLTGSKVGTGISATNVTTGTLPDAVIPSTITRDTELTTALGSYTTTSALTTLLSGKMNVATGTPDGTKFLRDDLTWQTIVAGGGSNYDLNSDGFIDDEFILSGITRDSELTTTLSSYVLSSVLSDYVTTATLSTNLNNYISSSALTTILNDYIQTGDSVSLGSITSTGPITSSGGTDGEIGIWWSGNNTISPTVTESNGIYPGSDGIYVRWNGSNSLIGAGGSGSVYVDGSIVNNPNLDSNGTVDVSVSGSNISSNVKANSLTLDNLTTGSVITSSESVLNEDTSVMTSGAVVKYINDTVNHLVNTKLSDAGFTITNYINPVSSPIEVTEASYTVSGNVYDNGTIPTVEVSLNGGTYASADVTGTTSPWGWSELLTLISGSNTIDVRVTNSDLEIVQLPQVNVTYTIPDLPTGSFTTPAVSGSWIQSATYILAAGTSQDDQGITSIQWKVGSDVYADATGTTSWTIPSITFSEGANTLYVLITGTPTSETTEISTIVNVDTINPVVTPSDDSTHNGIDTIVSNCSVTETNISSVTFVASNATPSSGTCTGTYPNYSTPSLTPTGTGSIVVTFTATDLSGRTGSNSQSFIYTGGGDLSDILFLVTAENNFITSIPTGLDATTKTLVVSSDYKLAGSNSFKYNSNVWNRAAWPNTNDNLFNKTSGVVGGWIRTGDTIVDDYVYFEANYNSSNYVALRNWGDDGIEIIWVGQGIVYVVHAAFLTPNAEYFIHFSYSGSTIKLFVNGEEITTTSSGTFTPLDPSVVSGTVNIGGSPRTGSSPNGAYYDQWFIGDDSNRDLFNIRTATP